MAVGAWGCMEMVWVCDFRAISARFGSFSVHFAHIVGARGGAGPRGYPWPEVGWRPGA